MFLSKRNKIDNTYRQYDLLAGLFMYPQPGFAGIVDYAQAYLNERYPKAAKELADFTEFVAGASQNVLEELFTRSFDVQSVTTLDLGYVLFGDDYKRGAMLVNLNMEHKEVENDCHTELSDHLPNVLRLLYKMRKPDLRAELVDKIIAPALRKIIGEFDPNKIEKKNAVYKKHHKTLIEKSEHYGTIYQLPLRALYKVIEADFKVKEKIEPGFENGFLSSVGKEMKIEPV